MNMFSSFVSPLASQYVNEVLSSGMLSEGKVVAKFEAEFERTFGHKKFSAVAVNSGTSALHLALTVTGIRGEVLLPANTFVATGLAVIYAGCTPVFCDILPDGTIDPEDVDRKIRIETVAVIAVNWAGKECAVDKLSTICKDNGLVLIIDAAQSLGCSNKGDFICYSFQATKHLTTADGGMLVCNLDLYKRAKRLRWFGISKDTKTTILGERNYRLEDIGFKYHMNDLSAALGLANLSGIKDRLEYYKTLANIYKSNLRSVIPLHDSGSFWAYPIKTDNAVRFSEFCKDRNIPCSQIHRGIDHNWIMGGVNNELLNQREWERTVTHLPIHMDIKPEDVEWICAEVNEYN